MPIVNAYVWQGWGKDNAKTLIGGITQVFVDMGVPPYAVEVLVHEVEKTHWGIQGGPASERQELKDWQVGDTKL
jgi:4-oxalocrotonate tautomerase